MTDMRYIINLVEGVVLNEAVTGKPWTLYHGTSSDGFDKFAPKSATKGAQFWNPLGNGMYATNDPRFAGDFGGNVFEVVIPAGTKYKRINSREWESVGRSLCHAALKKAMKANGESFEAWENGVYEDKPSWKPAKMSREELSAELLTFYTTGPGGGRAKSEEEIRMKIDAASDDQLRGSISNIIKNWFIYGSKRADKTKESAIFNFRHGLRLERYSPYEGLVESTGLVEAYFTSEIARDYEITLPALSDAKFRQFDMIVFAETSNTFRHYDKDGKEQETWEVVIYKPELQRTSKPYKDSEF